MVGRAVVAAPAILPGNLRIPIPVKTVPGSKPPVVPPIKHINVPVVQSRMPLKTERSDFQVRVPGNRLLKRIPPMHTQNVLKEMIGTIDRPPAASHP